MIDFYGYSRCDTCRKAQRALDGVGTEYRFIDITETAPPRELLELALRREHTLTDLFNRSGVQYRELNMKAKVKTLSEGDLLDLLADNGRLCKRPFVTDGTRVTVGFKDADAFGAIWGA